MYAIVLLNPPTPGSTCYPRRLCRHGSLDRPKVHDKGGAVGGYLRGDSAGATSWTEGLPWSSRPGGPSHRLCFANVLYLPHQVGAHSCSDTTAGRRFSSSFSWSGPLARPASSAHFSKSNEATFRVTGSAIDTASIAYWRVGANARTYLMPVDTSIAVDHEHMRNTIQIGFTLWTHLKRRRSSMSSASRIQGSTNIGSKSSALKSIAQRPMLSIVNDPRLAVDTRVG